MQCENCGAEYDDSFSFCPYCGKRVVEEDLPSVQKEPIEKAQQEKLILIVDDNEALVRVLSTQLRLRGYKAIAALDGEQAVMIAHRKKPGLILLDIAMPGLHGFAVIDKLRQSEHTENIPIVIVSGSNEPDSVKKAELMGIRDYIVKPYEEDHLMEIIGCYFS